MAAIHLASCDLVAFLRTFDRLQRSPFFIKASTSIGWGVGPDRPNACTALHSLPGEYFHLICPESSIKVPYPLRRKERSSPLGRLCGKPDSWRWQLMHDGLVSVRRRGQSFSHIHGDDGIGFTISASPHLPPLLLPNVHSIRRMAFPSIDPTSAHLAYPILSLFLASYALFPQLIRNRLHFVRTPQPGTLVGEYPNGSNNCCKQNQAVMTAYYFRSYIPAQRLVLTSSSSNALLGHSLAL
jgi:hypothetical protein